MTGAGSATNFLMNSRQIGLAPDLAADGDVWFGVQRERCVWLLEKASIHFQPEMCLGWNEKMKPYLRLGLLQATPDFLVK